MTLDRAVCAAVKGLSSKRYVIGRRVRRSLKALNSRVTIPLSLDPYDASFCLLLVDDYEARRRG